MKRSVFITGLALVLVACGVVAPVQEMSDARQAIENARAALQHHKTADSLSNLHIAEEHLHRAEAALATKDYPTARQEAKLAYQFAIQSR